MAITLKIKRGLASDLPALAEGEPGFTLDDKKLYIGHTDGNVQVSSDENYTSDEKTKLAGINTGITTTGNSNAYSATVPWITELTTGVSFIMVPHVASTSTVTLNVNGLGAKNIRRRISGYTSTTTNGSVTNWLKANKPVLMMYDGTYWIVSDLMQPNASDLYGTVPISSGGTGEKTAKDALKSLGIMASTNEELVINSMECIGNVTSDRKNIYFTIILPKMIDTDANSISVTSLKLNIRKVAGGYIGASSSYVAGGYQYVGNSSYTIGMEGLNPFCVRLYLTNNNSTFDTTNNTPVSVNCVSAILKVV